MGRKGFLVLASVALLGVSFGTPIRAAEQAIRIGVQLPLTGERAPVGRLIRNSIEMAIEDLNRRGGVNGVPMAIIYEDDQDTREGAVEAVRKLARDHQALAIVGELFSPFVLASREVVEQEGVSLLTGGTSPRTTEQTRWIFRVGASDALLADVLARYAAERLKLKTLAVFHDRTGIHNARAEMLVKVLQERYGIAPMIRASWKPGDRDFTAQLERVRATSPQGLVALGETPEGGAFLRQIKGAGVGAAVIVHRDFGARRALEEAGETAEGVLIVTEYMPALLDPERQAWAQAYERRTGAEANVIAAQYYDAIFLLAEAVKRGGPSRQGIKTGLLHLKGFRGMMADYTFDEKQNGVHRFYVARITSGKPILIALLEKNP